MNLENINCPQFVDFTTNAFLESFKDCSSSNGSQSLNQSNSDKENYGVEVGSRSLESKTRLRKPSRLRSCGKLRVLDINCINTETISKDHHGKNKVSSNLTSKSGEKLFLKKQIEKYSLVGDKVNNENKTYEPCPTLKKGNCASVFAQRISKHNLAKSCPTAEILNQKEIVKVTENTKQSIKCIESKTCEPEKISKDAVPNMKKEIKVKSVKKLEAKFASPYVFRARPLPKNIFIRPTGLGQKLVIKNTVAKSPFFHSEERIKKRKLLQQMNAEKEKPPKKAKIENTKPQVISRGLKLKSSVKQLNCNKGSNFLRKKSPVKPPNKNKSLVFQEQFIPTFQSTLLSDSSNNLDQNESFSLSFEESLLKDTNICAGSGFLKEQPSSALHKKSFMPEKLQKRKTEFQEFKFQTIKRARERMQLKNDTETQNDHKEQLHLKKEVEQLQRYPLRKSHFIAPHDTIRNKPHQKRVTIAISPKFETDKRLRSKSRESKYYGLV